MKNPLRDLSRPKALGLAGVAAGVLAISGGAAAINVGLLSSGASEPFNPQPVSVTEGAPSTTTSAPADPEIVYKDVYEHVSGTTGDATGSDDPAATLVAPPTTNGSPAQSVEHESEGDGSPTVTDEADKDSDEVEADDDADDDGEHESDDEVEHEDPEEHGGVDD